MFSDSPDPKDPKNSYSLYLVSPAKGPRPTLGSGVVTVSGWFGDWPSCPAETSFLRLRRPLDLGRGSFSRFAESLPHPRFILLVLPTNGGDSVPRIEFLRSTLTGGLDAEARFPSGPRFQMASDVSAIPLGRIAPSSWEVCSRLGEVYLRPSFFRWYRGKEDSCRVLALRSCVPLANA